MIARRDLNLSADLIVRFMTEQPFFYGVWTQLRTSWRDEADFPFPAGVMYSGKGFTLLLQRETWQALDADSKILLLAHECAHVALGHVPPDDQTRALHKAIANISQDIFINEHFRQYKGCALAATGQWLSNYPFLPQDIKDQDWRGIYDKIMGHVQEAPKSGAGFDDHESHGQGDPAETTLGQGEGEGTGLTNGDLAELAKAQAEEIARNAARHCQIRGTESSIPQALRIALAKPKKTHIQLVREILQRFVANSRDTKKRLTWRRVSRRLGAVARGRLSARLPRVAVAVDSSGSMCGQDTIDLMGQVISAVCAVADRVDAVVGDTEVRASATLNAGNVMTTLPEIMKGGGGTTLQPLLRHLAEGGSYDAVILLTDGYCEALEAQQPTIALITPGGTDAPGVASVHLQESERMRWLRQVKP